ncbi:MAG: hypothetical protein P1U58_02750 [Verrucomicrobiales bacterium]|nr:hypothetical protein [Verrucomicrobiales bacterium]
MKRFLILTMSLGIFVIGCRDESSQSDGVEQKEERDQDMIGLSLSEAEKLAVKRGLLYRVTMLDGKPQPATRDRRENRVNFVVEAGKVLGVSRG